MYGLQVADILPYNKLLLHLKPRSYSLVLVQQDYGVIKLEKQYSVYVLMTSASSTTTKRTYNISKSP